MEIDGQVSVQDVLPLSSLSMSSSLPSRNAGHFREDGIEINGRWFLHDIGYELPNPWEWGSMFRGDSRDFHGTASGSLPLEVNDRVFATDERTRSRKRVWQKFRLLDGIFFLAYVQLAARD